MSSSPESGVQSEWDPILYSVLTKSGLPVDYLKDPDQLRKLLVHLLTTTMQPEKPIDGRPQSLINVLMHPNGYPLVLADYFSNTEFSYHPVSVGAQLQLLADTFPTLTRSPLHLFFFGKRITINDTATYDCPLVPVDSCMGHDIAHGDMATHIQRLHGRSTINSEGNNIVKYPCWLCLGDMSPDFAWEVFDNPDRLHDHLSTHHLDTDPFICPYCDIDVPCMSSLVTHFMSCPQFSEKVLRLAPYL